MEIFAVAVDFGGTNIRVAAVDEHGTIHKRIKRPAFAQQGQKAITRNLRSAIEEIFESLTENRVKGVGLAIAGAIDIRKGTITQSPNLPGCDNYPVRDELQAGFLKHVPVIVENDANAAALGERWKGAGIGSNNLLCLTLGTGIGGGIIVDGNLVHGADGTAGELGHITVFPDGPRCGCGNNGCLEALASATAITREATKAAAEHPESDLRARSRGRAEAITAEMVYRSAASGDHVSQNIYFAMGKYLGIGIGSLINIFNPEIVVIGGGVSCAWELFSPSMHEEIEKRAFKMPAQRARIVPAACGDDAGLLGAAHVVFSGIA
jgi:glucokinase